MARNFHTNPAAIIGLTDSRVCLEFNRACNYLLIRHDNEVEAARRKDEGKITNHAVLSANAGKIMRFDDEAEFEDDEYITV